MSTSTQVNRSPSRGASAEDETLNREHDDAAPALRKGCVLMSTPPSAENEEIYVRTIEMVVLLPLSPDWDGTSSRESRGQDLGRLALALAGRNKFV